MQKQKHSLASKLLLGLTVLFFYLPIIYIVVFSFNSSRSRTTWAGFSTRWYETLFQDTQLLSALWLTVWVALVSALAATLIGTAAAVGINGMNSRLRRVFMAVNNIPMVNPEIVTAIGLLMFFSSLGVNKGLTTMLLAHIMFCTPYVILSVTPKLRSLDPNLADAALDLGATPLQALTKVIVPQIMPGIVSGALIAFTMSFDDFVISYFVTGNGVNNISILVYTMSKRVNPSINALSTLVIALITVVLIIVNVVPIIKEKRRTKA